MIKKPCSSSLQLNNEIGLVSSFVTADTVLIAGDNVIPFNPIYDLDNEINLAGEYIASRDKFIRIIIPFTAACPPASQPLVRVYIYVNNNVVNFKAHRGINDGLNRSFVHDCVIYIRKNDVLKISFNVQAGGAGNIISTNTNYYVYDILSCVTNKLRILAMCQYQADTDLAIPDAVLTNPLIFNTYISDSDVEYNTATGIYTAIRNKWVNINIQLSLAINLAGANNIVTILHSYYNTVIEKDYQKIEKCNSVSNQLVIRLNHTKYLKKNDTIEFKIFQSNDNAQASTILGASFPAKCDFTIRELNPYAVYI
jgi:hypothetical protein